MFLGPYIFKECNINRASNIFVYFYSTQMDDVGKNDPYVIPHQKIRERLTNI